VSDGWTAAHSRNAFLGFLNYALEVANILLDRWAECLPRPVLLVVVDDQVATKPL
jgi:hypothetical protein